MIGTGLSYVPSKICWVPRLTYSNVPMDTVGQRLQWRSQGAGLRRIAQDCAPLRRQFNITKMHENGEKDLDFDKKDWGVSFLIRL